MHETTKVFGQLLNCPICRNNFSLCNSCYRGQKYCSKPCRLLAIQSQRREATARYQSKAPGKKNHRTRQNTYRHRQHQKNVTHASSPIEGNRVEPPTKANRKRPDGLLAAICCFDCNQRIDFFSNEFTASPVTDRRRRKRRGKLDQYRKGGRDPPTFLR